MMNRLIHAYPSTTLWLAALAALQVAHLAWAVLAH